MLTNNKGMYYLLMIILFYFRAGRPKKEDMAHLKIDSWT
jgi:hypothetical protein